MQPTRDYFQTVLNQPLSISHLGLMKTSILEILNCLLGILIDALPTVFGGVILTVIFFTFREWFFRIPNLSGEWNVITTTENTTYSPYQGMELKYIVVLCCMGNRIQGTSEKISENTSSNGEVIYPHKTRIRGKIDGHIEHRYLSKSKVVLHIVEDGDIRESTTYHELKVLSKTTMRGTFFSTAANSRGSTNWQKKS